MILVLNFTAKFAEVFTNVAKPACRPPGLFDLHKKEKIKRHTLWPSWNPGPLCPKDSYRAVKISHQTGAETPSRCHKTTIERPANGNEKNF